MLNSFVIEQFTNPKSLKIMTNYQESYEKMSLSSTSFLSNNSTITSTLTGFSTYFPVIEVTNAQIQVVKVQQEADKSGDTSTKKEYKTTLIANAIDVARKTTAYATNVNNRGLLNLVNYSESDLKRSSDSNLISICQVIHDNANSYQAALASYNITADILVTLQTSINNFNAAIPKVRTDTTGSEQATKVLATLFKTLQANWDKIDTLVEMVRTSEPNFYNEYQNVRKIINTGAGSLSLKIKVYDSISGEGVANVTLTVTLTGSSSADSIVKKTADAGGSNFKSLDDGDYTVTAKKPGYKDATASVSVVNGESTVLDIKIEKA